MGNKTQFRKLFEPARIGKMEVKNRITMAPMGTQLYDDGFVTDRLKDYYEARAKGGAGMITIDHLKISFPVGAGKKGTARIDDDKFIPALSELVDVVHQHGAKMVAQLGHMGPADAFPIGETPLQSLAASSIGRQPDYTHPSSSVVHYSLPREMTVDEIKETVACFASAAKRAQKAGFDAVQVHAANRYLLNSFVSPAWNRRQDSYGGNLKNRARFTLEAVEAVRQVVGQDYPISCRINGEERDIYGGITPELAAEFAQMLEEAGVDAIDVSGMYPHLPGYDPGFNVSGSAAIKKAVTIPVIVAGGLGPEVGEKILRQGKADFICVGRPLIADSELPNKAASGRLEDIAPCVYCNCCLAVDRECTVNAARAREREYEIGSADKTKKVLVVGGGPGGMEAARVAALRGHQVTLYEKERKLGGQLISASILRKEYEALTKYLTAQMKKLGVRVNLRKEVNSSLIAEVKPDVIVLATGATPVLPEIPGIDRDNVISGADVQYLMHGGLGTTKKRDGWRRFIWYLGSILVRAPFGPAVIRWLMRFRIPFGKKIIIVGKGLAGIEIADFLVQRGKKVTIVDTREEVPFTEPPMSVLRQYMEDELRKSGVEMLSASRYEWITSKGLTTINKGEQLQSIEGDTVVFTGYYRPNTGLSQALADMPYEVHLVGDCAEPCGILEAIRDGSRIGRVI
ncbi:FAD-dependent oxidoreductase [Chloroflexota bacterium]